MTIIMIIIIIIIIIIIKTITITITITIKMMMMMMMMILIIILIKVINNDVILNKDLQRCRVIPWLPPILVLMKERNFNSYLR